MLSGVGGSQSPRRNVNKQWRGKWSKCNSCMITSLSFPSETPNSFFHKTLTINRWVSNSTQSPMNPSLLYYNPPLLRKPNPPSPPSPPMIFPYKPHLLPNFRSDPGRSERFLPPPRPAALTENLSQSLRMIC